jgi:hypothetical protein
LSRKVQFTAGFAKSQSYLALAKFAKAVKHPKMGLPPPEVREGSGLGAAADETNGAGL